MTRRHKHLILTITAQVGCLAVGLWMQQRFLETSIVRQATLAEWMRLDEGLDRLDGANSTATNAETIGRAQEELASGLGIAARSSREASPIITVADADWRVRRSTSSQRSGCIPGLPLNWAMEEENLPTDVSSLHGTITLADGIHLASARRTPDGGYVLLHRPREEVVAEVQQFLTFVPTLSVLTLIWTSALLGLLAYMLLARFHDVAERERAKSLAEGLRQRQDLVRTRDAVVFGLAKLADSRDGDTGDHLERISVYATLLASRLRRCPKYAGEVTPGFVRLIGISSALHDIGKVGVQDSILLKPAALTPEERGRMEAHAVIGGECLRKIERRLGSSNFLHMARDIAFAHHERWDGNGYPHGLRGEQIPLAARIVAIADVYDALSTRRIYKQPRSHDECVRIISAAAGTHFDPDMVQAWLSIAPKFAAIAARNALDRVESKATLQTTSPDLAAKPRHDTERNEIASADSSQASNGFPYLDEAVAPT